MNKGDCDCAKEDPAEEEYVFLSGRVLMPVMNFLSKSRSMAVRLPNGVERLAESRSMLDKKLWELFMVVRQEVAVESESCCH